MSGPKEFEDKLDRFLNAWRTLAPDKTFGGMTLTQFESGTAPSKQARAELEELEDKKTQALAKRDAADEVSNAKMQLVVAGVLADPTEGPNSALYIALGYTGKSARKTGLTRKRKETPVKQG